MQVFSLSVNSRINTLRPLHRICEDAASEKNYICAMAKRTEFMSTCDSCCRDNVVLSLAMRVARPATHLLPLEIVYVSSNSIHRIIGRLPASHVIAHVDIALRENES